MAKNEYQEFLKKMTSPEYRKGDDSFMIYGPLTDAYWDQKIKILVINLETYGFDGWEEDIIVDINRFDEWMRAKNTETVHNTAMFIHF